jgi:hypothetical protein
MSIEAIPEPMLAPSYSSSKPARSMPTRSAEELDYSFANERAVPHDPDFARDPEIAGGKILSITDRKLAEAETDRADLADSTDSITPANGGGWTAREVSTRSP